MIQDIAGEEIPLKRIHPTEWIPMSMIWFYFKIILMVADPKLKFEHERKKMNFYKKNINIF